MFLRYSHIQCFNLNANLLFLSWIRRMKICFISHIDLKIYKLHIFFALVSGCNQYYYYIVVVTIYDWNKLRQRAEKNVWWLPMINTVWTPKTEKDRCGKNKGNEKKCSKTRLQDARDEFNFNEETRMYFHREEETSTLLPRTKNNMGGTRTEVFSDLQIWAKEDIWAFLSPLELFTTFQVPCVVTSRGSSACRGALQWSSTPMTGYLILTNPGIKN